MWILLVFVVLVPSLGTGLPLSALRLPAISKNDSVTEPWNSGTSPAPPVTPTTLPPHSEAPALSLNLGLNFKIKVRSQGKGQQASEGPRGATADPGLTPAGSQAPGSRFWAEALGGSGWLGPGPAEELPSSPGGWPWEGSPAPAEPRPPASSPTPQPPLTLWPRLTKKGLVVPVAGEDSRELEFKIDIDLTAGVGKEGNRAPNGSGPSRHLPLLPGIRVGFAEVANKWWESPGLFGSKLPAVTWEPPERNATGDAPLTPEGAVEPGAESRSPPAASPGSGGAFVALPGCPPDGAEECGAEGPAWGLLALCGALPGPAEWRGALAAGGPAWQAPLYGTGALFALLAALALLGLAAAPCRRRPPSPCLVAPLQLLLAGAGGARAALLLSQAAGWAALLPAPAARLLHELPLPCLAWALALGALLLRRPPAKRPPTPALPRPPAAACLLALPLLLLHFALAAAAATLAAPPRPAPALLLAARGLFALLAALLSAALLALSCPRLPRRPTALPDGGSSPRRGSRTALPAALSGLLSAGLHAYAVVHALGYGLPPALLGPWAWWALQLAALLCEAGVGLPLALLALRPLCCCCCCASPGRAAAKTPPPPGGLPRGLAQCEKLLPDGLALDPLPAVLSISLDAASDPTADFRPPSPIDLRRSIDEALCNEGLLPGGGGLPGPLSACGPLARPSDGPLFRTASCLALGAAEPHEALPESPGSWRGGGGSSSSDGNGSPGQRSTDASSLALSVSPAGSACPLPEGLDGSPPPHSPPPPGRQCWARAPASQESLLASAGARGAEAAQLQAEFLDVCRQIDALSMASDTVDL